jgi:hypothetical protein
MTSKPDSLTVPAAVRAAAVGGLLAMLAACAAMQGDPPPRVLAGNETQVKIVAGLDSSPRALAQAHCSRYGRQAVVHDAVPVSDNLVQGWATGRKAFVYTFDCL